MLLLNLINCLSKCLVKGQCKVSTELILQLRNSLAPQVEIDNVVDQVLLKITQDFIMRNFKDQIHVLLCDYIRTETRIKILKSCLLNGGLQYFVRH